MTRKKKSKPEGKPVSNTAGTENDGGDLQSPKETAMFAVPGWSVSSASLKPQAEPAQNESQPKDASTPNAQNKKRKRNNGNDKVTTGNVDEMFRKHIEGKPAGQSKQNKHKHDKKAAEKPASQKSTDNAGTQAKRQEKKKDQKHKDSDNQSKVTGEPTESAEADTAQDEENSAKKRKRNRKDKEGDSQQKVAGGSVKPVGAETAQTDGKPAKKQSNKKKEKKEDAASTASKETAAAAVESLAPPPATTTTLTPLQQAMRQKLISSRFRHLNETLYTTDSSTAVELFKKNPELFDEYHLGFSRQVKESWPSNPVDAYIQTVLRRGAVNPPKKGKKPNPNQALPLPRRPDGGCTIVDLGCGDGKLARTLTKDANRLKLKLHSYDLQSPHPVVTQADIANLPVKEGSVDVAIFCLSLMGTNWVSFVEEAWRVLRGDGKGEVWVSEVKSRFGKVARKKSQIGAQKPLSKTQQKKQNKNKKAGDDDSDLDDADIFAEDARPTDNDETDISAFIEVFRTRGFVLRPESVDKSNKMFVKMEFVKAGGAPTKGKHASVAPTNAFKKAKPDVGMTSEQEAQVLKPCVYKTR
ncbi:hypothetical protein N7532_000622 [Penicillium argentinense]|uniref:Ribosomal RNA-processing protein 8 n=1 Tax=Penicillium argentinense TaxID=1131581 RepID=A0A9W9KP10_9EURO|nr:uncharacterized protein N7532_000622 [Penicillium argentinense]KAJ5112577.1 hypothetical protein N7532_000622 [Penicillium argentinense]